MRLLIITQKIDINDDNLGFFHRWVEEFAKNTDKVFVIAQAVGDHDLPKNVIVSSLGKERGFSKLRQLVNFYRLLFKYIGEADAVFVHMIPLWVVLGAPLYKIFHKKVYLWYVHKSVTFTLRIAEKVVAKIFTASRESFRLPSKKVEVAGHGIDTEYFSPKSDLRSAEVFRVISVGRISATKKIKEMILAAGELRKILPAEKKFELVVVGSPRMEEDEKYFTELKKLVSDQGLENTVKFIGSVPYGKIAAEYQKSHLFLNFSLTGSVDKAVLEAMSAGLDVLVANEAFFDILPRNHVIRDMSPDKIVASIKEIMEHPRGIAELRDLVKERYDLRELIKKLVLLMG